MFAVEPASRSCQNNRKIIIFFFLFAGYRLFEFDRSWSSGKRFNRLDFCHFCGRCLCWRIWAMNYAKNWSLNSILMLLRNFTSKFILCGDLCEVSKNVCPTSYQIAMSMSMSWQNVGCNVIQRFVGKTIYTDNCIIFVTWQSCRIMHYVRFEIPK